MDSTRVGGLVVTLAPIAEVRAEAMRLSQEAEGLHASASQHRAEAASRLVEVGRVLVAREKAWHPANPAATYQLARSREALARIDGVGESTDDDDGKPRFALFGRRKQTAATGSAANREHGEGEPRVVVAELGRAFGGALRGVSGTHRKIMQMEERADQDLARAAQLQDRAELLTLEAGHRDRAVRELGFDAPLIAAELQRAGAPAVKSPLELRAGEVAFLVEDAELARDKSYAINTAAATVPPAPVEVTGIPFTVGSHRGQAIRRDSMSMLGPGVFVVTNQRLGFHGKLKSFSFPIDDLLNVEQYGDGLSLLREGRDNADVVISSSAGRILFFINWVLLQRTA